jgi:hypothetical protein
MPTDNGVLLRQAMLSEDCMRDLVRPLRDAGWSVAVSEPDEKGLYKQSVLCDVAAAIVVDSSRMPRSFVVADPDTGEILPTSGLNLLRR